MKGEHRFGRDGEEVDRVGRPGVVGRPALLVIVALVRGHYFNREPLAFDLRNDVPERQRAAHVPALATPSLPAEQEIE